METEEKNIKLGPSVTDIYFAISSQSTVEDGINLLGLYLRTVRQHSQAKCRVRPIGHDVPGLLCLAVKSSSREGVLAFGQGLVFSTPSMTRNFPCKVILQDIPLIQVFFDRSSLMKFEMATFLRDFYAYEIKNNGELVRRHFLTELHENQSEIIAKKAKPQTQTQNRESQFQSETASTTHTYTLDNIPSDISEKYAALEKENIELKVENLELKERMGALEKENIAESLSQLRLQVSGMESQNETFQTKIKTQDSEILELKSSNKILQSEINGLKREFSQFMATFTEKEEDKDPPLTKKVKLNAFVNQNDTEALIMKIIQSDTSKVSSTEAEGEKSVYQKIKEAAHQPQPQPQPESC